MGFAEDLQKICDRTGDKVEDMVRGASLEMLKSVVKMSPVDSGRFRGNWQVAFGIPNIATSAALDKSGAQSISRGNGVLSSWDGGNTIYITNSLPYAQKLEYGLYGNPVGSANGPKTAGGYSTQAPGGMVRLTVQRFNNIVQKEAAKVK